MVEKKGFDLDTDKLYIPVDVTPNSGSTHCDNYNLDFDREADFVIAPPEGPCDYDPTRDSEWLKASPDKFEWFRGNYPVRRERS